MTGDIVPQLIPFVVLAIVAVQVVRTAQRRFRALAAERRIAQQPVTAARATPAQVVAPPATRTTQPVARMPKRIDPPAAAAPRPPAPLLPAAGPRWAANAVVAAEVFGPPLALRPDGTLGSPQAF